jgi:hypothetical protein
MKKLAGTLITLSLLWVSSANATIVNQTPYNSEQSLNVVWNSLFGTNVGTSQELFNNFGVPNATDHFYSADDGQVHLEIRYAGNSEQLGFRSSGIDTVLPLPTIEPGTNYGTCDITIPGDDHSWMWFLNSHDGTNYTWYSNDNLNADQADHFVTFAIPDALRDYYNANNGLHSDIGPNAYLCAFEDEPIPGADCDYNDLIFIANNVFPHAPEPASMILFAMGILGLFGIKKIPFLRSRSSC